MDIVSLIISILALISSAYIGIQQVRISKTQVDLQNKVELYLLADHIHIKHVESAVPDRVTPAIFVRNIGSNVIYLTDYVFDGKEYPLQEVLPPVDRFDGYRYIYLPSNGNTHVSFVINFKDWQNTPWMTKGFADFKDGKWDLIYEPCKKVTKRS